MKKRTKPHEPAVAPRPAAPFWTAARLEWSLALGLLAVTFLTYLPVLKCGFVNFDDNDYVTASPELRQGLSGRGLYWAWTAVVSSNWHPLTLLSLLLDYQLFGLEPHGYHLVNLLLHLANTLLLFRCMCALTGYVWRSAVVAALFALHPLHVESVAWVSERKDLLSTLFGLLALRAYVWYAAQPRPARLALVSFLLLLSLLAKPMWVTFPFLLLLLDFWPLRRLERWRPLLVEKLPLFVLIAAISVVTMLTQVWHPPAATDVPSFSLASRLGNAVVSVAEYLRQTALPTDLTVLYPHPGAALSGWAITASALLVAVVSLLAWGQRRNVPYLFVGWFWYLGMLVPVLGLVQVGVQARADRYTYVPLVGVFLLLTWGAADLLQRAKKAWLATPLAASVLLIFVLYTRLQLASWENSHTLWRQALAHTSGNAVAHFCYATALLADAKTSQELNEAAKHFGAYIELRPDDPKGYASRGDAYLQLDRKDEAIRSYQAAVRLQRELPSAQLNLGLLQLERGRLDEAADSLRVVLACDTNEHRAWYNLGRVYLRQKRYAEAEECFRPALRLSPSELALYVYVDLAEALAGLGQFRDAIASVDSALARVDPVAQADFAKNLQQRRRAYEMGQPYRPE